MGGVKGKIKSQVTVVAFNELGVGGNVTLIK